MPFWSNPIHPTPENQALLAAYYRDEERDRTVKRAAEEQRISSLQQVYSNMKFFDMLQLISIKYHELMAAQRWNKNDDVTHMMERIIVILNKYRLTKFNVEDKGTIFFTFRSELRGRGGWGTEVTIVRIVSVTDNLMVKYKSSENANDPIELPCAGVEFHPIEVVEMDEKYKTPLIEFVESGRSMRNCILTEPNNPTVLTDKPCDKPYEYAPDVWEHMMFFPLNDNIYRIILSEMAEVLEGLLSNVEEKTDMRRKAFEKAIKETTNNVKIDKLSLIRDALSPQDKIKEVDLHTNYHHPKSLIELENNAVINLFDRRATAADGGKLRSAKKTSKCRSVKSKPRYYRRSVGSINHRRKKTTRRRR